MEKLLKENLKLAVIGIITGLIVIELSLRIFGYAFTSYQNVQNADSLRRSGTYKIICVGESTTAYGGKDSYPSQLEKILNTMEPGARFSVINKGEPGGSTSMIVENMDSYIEQYKPNMIVAMMGINDEYLSNIPYENSRMSGIKKFLMSFRLYKVYRYLYKNIFRQKIINEAQAPRGLKSMSENEELPDIYGDVPSVFFKLIRYYDKEKRYTERDVIYAKAIKRDKSYYRLYLLLGREHRDNGRYLEAAKIFLRVARVKPDSFWAYFELGGCYRHAGQYNNAAIMYEKAIAIDPSNHWAYGGLALCYERLGEPAKSNAAFKKAEQLQLTNYVPITRENYRKLAEIAKNKGIKMVFVQYPVRSVNQLIKLVENQEGLIFVDNALVFRKEIERLGYEDLFSDSFAGDFGHCTPKGNRLLAKNIADTIIDNL